MLATQDAATQTGEAIDLVLAADLQDHLLTASHDLDRLQSLLAGTCEALTASFFGANALVERLGQESDTAALPALSRHLSEAVTALQFQDIASQLIAHTRKRLRNCADRLAASAFDEDGEGDALIEDMPLRPNPVTQDEMDAGSVELF
ncbi:MAG: hypothetical protein V4792_08500 [Pseudomonadota bacterium]